MKRIILFVGRLGIIFLASAVQAFGTNWLGQACRNPACVHLEGLAVGIGLSTAAYIAWESTRSPKLERMESAASAPGAVWYPLARGIVAQAFTARAG
jgi:hypothetical protein